MNQTTDTDNEVACHYCGAGIYAPPCEGDETTYWKCGTDYVEEWGFARSSECYEFELTAKNNEVARLRERIAKLESGWKKARKAHLETCKNAQVEIDKLHTENICLQELIQEFYEWSRRDYPTEAEVREIMDRYYNLLNK
jgi:hypothetical protein